MLAAHAHKYSPYQPFNVETVLSALMIMDRDQPDG
jgi:hypothetical protein